MVFLSLIDLFMPVNDDERPFAALSHSPTSPFTIKPQRPEVLANRIFGVERFESTIGVTNTGVSFAQITLPGSLSLLPGSILTHKRCLQPTMERMRGAKLL